MAAKKTTVPERLRKLGRAVRKGLARQHGATDQELARVRAAVKAEWDKEQTRRKSMAEDEVKEKERQKEETERHEDSQRRRRRHEQSSEEDHGQSH